MTRIVYVNGDFVPENAAQVSVFDRGFLMADAVYEVTAILGGKILEFDNHMKRLRRSLDALQIVFHLSDDELLAIHRELIERNRLEDGMIYLQVTRGVADRDFSWPKEAVAGVVLFTQARDLLNAPDVQRGLRVISAEDWRWRRRDIKTTQLLYPSFAKMQAKAAGKDDAWLVEEGNVTEGTSSNAYIVTRSGTIITRNLSNEILHGITRASVLALAQEMQITIEERPFTIAEAQQAAEAFVTAASAFVCPVIEIDGVAIGSGKPGPIARRLREIYIQTARESAQ